MRREAKGSLYARTVGHTVLAHIVADMKGEDGV